VVAKLVYQRTEGTVNKKFTPKFGVNTSFVSEEFFLNGRFTGLT